jgi:deoxyadenosine/deoxycytidine kinase
MGVGASSEQTAPREVTRAGRPSDGRTLPAAYTRGKAESTFHGSQSYMLTLTPARAVAPRPGCRAEILAVFGAGKTTLATQLACEGATLIGEDHERNPFWGDAASVGTVGYLAYDLSFLLQHAYLVATAPADVISICDWSFATDLLWASLRLGRDLPAYEAVHAALTHRLPDPAGYLYLRQKPETIVERLELRSRPNESSFKQYVEAACDHLDALVAGLPAEQVLLVGDDLPPAEFGKWIRSRTREDD